MRSSSAPRFCDCLRSVQLFPPVLSPWQKIVLSKGTFELAAGDFNKNYKTKTDKTTCAVVGSSHASNLRISHGTGACAKITGSVAIKGTFFELAKKSPSGKCDLDKTPISASDVITGTGTVSY